MKHEEWTALPAAATPCLLQQMKQIATMAKRTEMPFFAPFIKRGINIPERMSNARKGPSGARNGLIAQKEAVFPSSGSGFRPFSPLGRHRFCHSFIAIHFYAFYFNSEWTEVTGSRADKERSFRPSDDVFDCRIGDRH